MLLEACEFSCVLWDFSEVTYHEPGVLNVRLTDLSLEEQEQSITEKEKAFPKAGQSKTAQQPAQPQYANPTPAGLFSFSMMVGLETAALLETLVPGSVDPAFALAHGYVTFASVFVTLFQLIRSLTLTPVLYCHWNVKIDPTWFLWAV